MLSILAGVLPVLAAGVLPVLVTAQHVASPARALAPSPTLAWNYTTGDMVKCKPALSADGATLFIGSDDSNVYALTTADGSVVWQYQTHGYVDSSPTLSADGATLFVGSDDGNVYALTS